MSITGSNNPFACNPVVFANANSIVSLGTITRDGNQFTFSVGFVWKINGVTYQNTAPVVLTIAEASEGFNRIDNALLNTSNTIELQQGLESETIALRPVAPETNIILTSWNISGTTIGDAEASILGTQFKKKSESAGYSDPTLTGSEAVIQLRPEGNSRYAFSHAGLVSIDGFGLDLITGNPDADAPYPGKDLFIENTGTTPFSLLHQGAGAAFSKFFFLDETDLVVPAGGKVWIKYGATDCEVIFKSWSDVELVDASETQSGIVNTTTQAFAGNKSIKGESSLTGNALEIKNSSGGTIAKFLNKKGVEIECESNTNGDLYFSLGDSSGVANRRVYFERLASSGGGLRVRTSSGVVFTIDGNLFQYLGDYILAPNKQFTQGSGVAGKIIRTIVESNYKFRFYSGKTNGSINLLTNLMYEINTDNDVSSNRQFSIMIPLKVGNNTLNDASSIFQVDSTTKGSLPFPRMTSTERLAISSPAIGLHVYQTDGTEGVYVYKSTGWTFAY